MPEDKEYTKTDADFFQRPSYIILMRALQELQASVEARKREAGETWVCL